MNKETYIIAELSANHNNNLDLAIRTVQSIGETGADAIKIQTYKPQSLTIDLDTGYFAPREKGLWKGYTPWNLYTEAAMPYEWQPKLQEIATDLGLDFFSSPFDLEGVDFLETLNVPKFKIASFEITDIELIRYTASKGKPMIISTGVAEIADIESALEACYSAGNKDITLLKCTSQYPASIKDANLRTMLDLKDRFGVKIGLSDHTMGSLVPIAAVALGATVVEKHFILDRKLGGPDSAFSMEPEEFKEMVMAIRYVEASLGEITYHVSDEDKNRRRSLFVVKDIKKGEPITEANVRSIRPGFGLHPKYLPEILGKTVNQDIEKGTKFELEFIK
jgi:pseudaminic acid synthase